MLARRAFQFAAILLLFGLSTLTFWALRERTKAVKSELAAVEQTKIAELQKTRADSAKAEAIINAEEAEKERLMALEEQKKAQRSEREANRQKELAIAAENRSKEAKQQALGEKEQALRQKRISDSLRVVADESAEQAQRQRTQDLAQSLAIRSILIRDKNEAELKALLALEAYKLNIQSEGDAENPILFKALNDAIKLKSDPEAFTLLKHKDAVRALVVSLPGSQLLSAGNDGDVIEWTIGGNSPLSKSILNENTNLKSFSVSTNWIACAGDDQFIRLWPRNDKGNISLLNYHSGNVSGLALQGDNLLSIAFDNTLKSYNVINKAVLVLDSFSSRPVTLATTNGIIWVGLENGEIRKIDLWNKQSITRLNERISSMSVSNDGKVLAIGCRSGNLYVLDADNGVQKRRMNAHAGSITSIAFGAQKLASVSLDGSMKVWSLVREDLAPITINDHESWIWCVAYDYKSEYFYSGGRDKSIRFYDLNYERNFQLLKRLVTRELTKQERIQYLGKAEK